MQYLKYDKSGYYIEPVISEECPENATAIPLPQPCWRPHWNGLEWIEEAPPPTDYDPDAKVAVWDADAKAWRVEPKPPDVPSVGEQLRALQILMGVDI